MLAAASRRLATVRSVVDQLYAVIVVVYTIGQFLDTKI